MYEFKIDKKTYGIYINFDELPSEVYVEYLQKFKDADLSNTETQKEIVYHFSNIPSQFKDLFLKEYGEVMYEYVQHLATEQPSCESLINSFEVNGTRYEAPPPVTYYDGTVFPMKAITTEQAITAADIISKIKDDDLAVKYRAIRHAMAFLFTPYGLHFNDDMVGSYAEEFKTVPVMTLMAALNYFNLMQVFVQRHFKTLFDKPKAGDKKYSQSMQVWGWYDRVAGISNNMNELSQNIKSNFYEFLQYSAYKKHQTEAANQ